MRIDRISGKMTLVGGAGDFSGDCRCGRYQHKTQILSTGLAMHTLFSRVAALAAGALLLLLAGCALPPSAQKYPISKLAAQQGVSLQRTLPEVLPDKSTPIPHSQFVLIPGESAAASDANPIRERRHWRGD